MCCARIIHDKSECIAPAFTSGETGVKFCALCRLEWRHCSLWYVTETPETKAFRDSELSKMLWVSEYRTPPYMMWGRLADFFGIQNEELINYLIITL